MSDGFTSQHEPPPHDAASYDALADLFLTDQAAASTDGAHKPNEQLSKPAPPPESDNGESERHLAEEHDPERKDPDRQEQEAGDIELVLAGHLPILGSPWLAQYADRLAEARGPVAMLQVRQGFVSVEVFHSTSESDADSRAERPGLSTSASASSLEEALLEACERARHWLLRCEEAQAAALANETNIEAFTVVSAVDEAAIVACYRTIKDVTTELRQRANRTPSWRFVAAGTEPGAAVPGFARLAASTERFLGFSLELGPVVERMRPMSVEHLGRWERDLEPIEAVAMIQAAREIKTQRRKQDRRRDCSPHIDAVNQLDERAFLDELRLYVREQRSQCETQADMKSNEQTKPTEERTREAKAMEATGDPLQPTDDEDRQSLCLAAALGLTPLMARCPWAGAVQLAVDEAGALHALAHHRSQTAVEQLLAASSWALAHHSLLSLLQPGVVIEADKEPMLHLFTDNAAEVRALIDSRVRLHLLLRPPYERRHAGCCCADLN